MSKKDNIDELFRDSMDDFRIEPPKDVERKVFAALFWSNLAYKYKGVALAVASAVVVGVGVWIFGVSKNENTEVANKDKVSNIETQSSQDGSNSVSEDIQNGTESQSFSSSNNSAQQNTNSSSDISFEATEPINREIAKDSKSSLNNSLDKANDEKRVAKSTPNRTKSNDLKSSNGIQNNSLNVPLSGVNGSSAKSQEKSLEGKKDLVDLNPISNKNESTNNVAEENETNESTYAESNNSNASKEPESIENKIDSVIAKNEAVQQKVDSASLASLSNDSSSKKENKKLPFDISVGPGVAFGYWNNRGEGSLPLDLSTNAQYSMFLSLSKNKISVSTGLGYETQNITRESSFWTTEEIDSNIVPVLQWDSTNSKNDTIDWDTTVNNNVFYHSAKDGRAITLNYLYVPLRFGYAYTFPGDKHMLSLQAGVGMHFLLNSSQGETPIDTALVKGTLFDPKKFILDQSLQLNYGYNFSKHLTAMVGVQFRSSFSIPVNSTDPKLDWSNSSKPSVVGTEIKLLYKF